MKRTIGFISLLFLILTTACDKKPKEESQQTQMERVMAIHDEVMPKMSTISRLVGELNKKSDTNQIRKNAVKELQASHNSMMRWMGEFGDRFDFEEVTKGKALSEEKQQWLNEEEEKVKALRKQINNSIAKAEKLLKK